MSFIVALVIAIPLAAQEQHDKLSLRVADAEQLFLRNNIQLLAQKCSIDSAKAAVLTAKLIDNPDFNISTGFYQPQTKRFFDYSYDNKEIAMQVSQLIKTAGKRNKNIALAKTGVAITEYEFADLVRTLLYTLHNDFYNIYYMQQTQLAYDTEINALARIAAAYREQVQKGNVAPRDLLRIQSQQYSLQAELATLQNAIDDAQSELKLLLRAKATVYIVPEYEDKTRKLRVADVPYTTLVDSAMHNRTDLKIATAGLTYSQQNLRLQKAMAVPDFSLGAGYDRLGSYVNNYNYLSLDVPLPMFNRNQGNIRQAKAGLTSSELQLQGTQDAVENQVQNAWMGALRAEKLLGSFDPSFEQNFSALLTAATQNFEKRNISLLEFIDLYDAYKQNVVQLNTLKYNLVSQLEQLNYTTGTRLFNN